VESYFKHPVADAIVAYAAEKNIVLKEAKVRQMEMSLPER